MSPFRPVQCLRARPVTYFGVSAERVLLSLQLSEQLLGLDTVCAVCRDFVEQRAAQPRHHGGSSLREWSGLSTGYRTMSLVRIREGGSALIRPFRFTRYRSMDVREDGRSASCANKDQTPISNPLVGDAACCSSTRAAIRVEAAVVRRRARLGDKSHSHRGGATICPSVIRNRLDREGSIGQPFLSEIYWVVQLDPVARALD